MTKEIDSTAILHAELFSRTKLTSASSPQNVDRYEFILEWGWISVVQLLEQNCPGSLPFKNAEALDQGKFGAEIWKDKFVFTPYLKVLKACMLFLDVIVTEKGSWVASNKRRNG